MTFGRFSGSQSISVVTSNFYEDPFDIPKCRALVVRDFHLDH